MAGFKFRDSYKIFNAIDPQVAGEELARISAENNGLTPKTVVEEARPKDAALHPAFEWRDKIAGELYREHQARNLIRTVVVEVPDRPDELYPYYIPLAPTHAEPGRYVNAADVVKDVDYTARALQVLTGKLTGAQKALQDFQRLVGAKGTETTALVALAASGLAAARDAIARIH